MAQPAAHSGSNPSFYINDQNRLVVRDDKGQEKQYKVVIRNKHGEAISLRKVDEKKLIPIIKRILEEANLNRQGVDLSLVKLKGNVVSYHDEKSIIKKDTYKKLQNTVAKVQKTAEKTTKATDETLKEAESSRSFKSVLEEGAKKLPFTAEDLTTAASRLKTSVKKKSEPIVDRLHKITKLFQKANPSGAKSLSEISYLLDDVIERKGKLVLKNDTLHFSEKKFGLSKEQKGGASALAAIEFVCEQVRERLESEDFSEDDLILAKDIMSRIEGYDWGKQALEKKKEVNETLNATFKEVKQIISDKSKVSGNYLTGAELYQSLINPKSSSLPDFLLSYRSMFKGDNYRDISKITNASVQASKSLEMLHFLKEQADAVKPRDYSPLIKLVETWLNNEQANGGDYRNPQVRQFIEDIIEGGQITVSSSGVADRLEKLLNEKLAVPEPAIRELKEGKQNWEEAALKIRKGQLNKHDNKLEYELLIRQFADDLITIGVADLQNLKLSDLDKDSPYSAAYLRQTEAIENTSWFIIRQILATLPDEENKLLPILHMRNFFVDVYELLESENRTGPAMVVFNAVTAPTIYRLKWGELSSDVQPIKELEVSQDIIEAKHNLRSARADSEKFIPDLTVGTRKLIQMSEGEPRITKKDDQGVVKFSETKMRNIASTKRKYQKAMENLKGSDNLHFADIYKNLRKPHATKEADRVNEELYTISYTIQPIRKAANPPPVQPQKQT